MFAYLLPFFIGIFSAVSLTMLRSIAPASLGSQLFFFFAGLAAFFTAWNIPFMVWKHAAKGIYWFLVFALLITLIIGKTAKGSTRWVSLGVAQFQPSQLMKPFLALTLAIFLMQKKKTEGQRMLHVGEYVAIAAGLVYIQPDLGTAAILVGVAIAGVFFSPLSPKWLLLGLCGLSALAVLAWSFFLHDYQRERVLTFLSPSANTLGTGYNALQAKIAVGSGKISGRGYGKGIQSSLRFLPERQTDFFFASFSEEFGFAGSIFIILLYGGLIFALALIGNSMTDPVGRIFSLSMAAMIAIQASMNIGMNLGLVPVVGITLPLLSLGGSSIVSICLALGIVGSAFRASSRAPHVEIRSFL